MKGIVVKSTGSWYLVETETRDLYRCRIRGKFRLLGKALTNPVAVGDRVSFEVQDQGSDEGLITAIGKRENYVVRQSPKNKHALHLLASNIDQALLLTTIVEPNLKPGFIDRFLLMTEPHDIHVIIGFNKSDLFSEENWREYEYLHAIYTDIGYRVLCLSANEKEGIQELVPLLEDKITLVSGQSGVGKSTLLNVLSPSLNIETDKLSEYSGKGKHTTTFAEMYTIKENIKVIDTPGIKTLSFNNLTEQDVRHNFRELFIYSTNCRFADCSHVNEPGCAVKAAVEEGEISGLRYSSYLQILDEIALQNRWERPKGY